MIGAKKLTLNTWLQVSMSVSIEPSRPPPSAFGEIAALLTSACSAPPSSRPRSVGVVGKVDLDVILRPGVPRAVFREGVPRTGDDAPAGAGKADHGRMADAAAGSGQKQRTPRRIVG